ncbi:MAG: signal transduction histidine kinase [Planctomycetota bacterium]|jgi:two-component system heavy metal sensor histidine kinase CusS
MIRPILAIAALACAVFAWGTCSSKSYAAPPQVETQSFPLDLERPLSGDAQQSHFYQCWLGGGVTVARSSNLGPADLPRLETKAGEPRYDDIVLPNGDKARAIAVRFLVGAPMDEAATAPDGSRARGAESHPVEVVVARSTRSVERSLQTLRWLLAATWAISMLTCAGIMHWLVRRGLSPLDKLSRQIRTFDQDRLDTWFELPGASEELEPVVRQLNGFVDRIREAFDREHAFTAHAAHEFRTPLAGLRSTLEVSLSKTRDADEYKEAEQACLKITTQLQRLIERLLELARAQAPDAQRRHDEISLNQLFDEAWLPFSDAAAEKGIALIPEIPHALIITTDRQLLRRVLENVLENAATYADDHSPLTLRATTGPDGTRIECTNQTKGLTPETAQEAFRPFWRGDSSRSSTGMHAGLGLALCKGFMEVLGGQITLDPKDDQFKVTLHLPPAKPAKGDA